MTIDPPLDDFDPTLELETLIHTLTRVEALAWATSQALGLRHGEGDKKRSTGRLHALVSLTGEVAEEALEETDKILDRLSEHMQAQVQGSGSDSTGKGG